MRLLPIVKFSTLCDNEIIMIRVKSLLVYILISMISNCSVCQMNKYNGFGEWYFGRPGLKNTYEIFNPGEECITDGKEIIVRVEEERHPFFLHFRLPEIIINPQGGFYFPKTSRDCFVLNKRGTKEDLDYNTFYDLFLLERTRRPGKKFNVVQGGIPGVVDTFIPYRLYTAKDVTTKDAVLMSLIAPIFGFGQVVLIFYIEIPVYTIHDALKTAVIPIAGVYYLSRDNGNEQ